MDFPSELQNKWSTLAGTFPKETDNTLPFDYKTAGAFPATTKGISGESEVHLTPRNAG